MNMDECQVNVESDSILIDLFNKHKIIAASFGDIKKEKKRVYKKYKEELEFRKDGGNLSISHFSILKKAVENGKLDLELLSEYKHLDSMQKDKLKDIFLRYRSNPQNDMSTTAFCYKPRNAIFFLDDSDKLVAYLEICFECRRSYLKPKSIYQLTKRCSGIYEPLKEFMAGLDLEYGIARNSWRVNK